MKKYIFSILILISQTAFNQRDTIGGAIFTDITGGNPVTLSVPFDFCAVNNGSYYVLYNKNVGVNKSLECVTYSGGNWVPADGLSIEVDTLVNDAKLFYNSLSEDLYCAYVKTDTLFVKYLISGTWSSPQFYLGNFDNLKGCIDPINNKVYILLHHATSFVSFDQVNGFTTLDNPPLNSTIDKYGITFNTTNEKVYFIGVNGGGFIADYSGSSWNLTEPTIQNSENGQIYKMRGGFDFNEENLLLAYSSMNNLIEIQSYNLVSSSNTYMTIFQGEGTFANGIINPTNDVPIISIEDNGYTKFYANIGSNFNLIDSLYTSPYGKPLIKFDSNGNLNCLYRSTNKLFLLKYPAFYLNTNEINDLNVQPFVFPNPAKTYLNLSQALYGSFQIYNQKGQLISTGNLKDQNRIDITELRTGNYILYINQLNGIEYKIQFVKN